MILAAYACAAFLLSRHQEFWSPDSAVRFVQAESLRRAGYRDVAVPYPAESLDPEGRFYPAGPWFHYARGGRHYLSYLPYFPAMSAVFYGALGYPGLILVPMIAGLAAVWATYAVLRRLVPGLAIAGTVTLALGTPLIVYSAVFWDHSLVVALAAGALACIAVGIEDSRCPLRGLLAAGALLGAGTWIRNEMYLLAAVAVGLWPLAARYGKWRGLLALGGGAGVMVGLQWMVNTRLYGSAMGYKGQGLVVGRVQDAVAAGTDRLSPWIADKLGNLYYQIVSPDFYAFNPAAVATGLGIAGALLLAGLLMRLGVGRRSTWLVTGGGLLATLTSVLAVSSRTSVSGLLLAMPFVVLLMLGGGRAAWERYLLWVAILFTLAVILTGTHGGLQWGPRYLLPVVPALVWLTAAAVDRARAAPANVWAATRAAAGLIAGASILVQVAGVEFVDFAIARNVRVNASLRDAPTEIIVTSLEWLVLGAGPIYFEKQLMFVDSVEDFRKLVDRLAERRVARWSYIPRSGGAFRQRQIEEWTAGGAWRYAPVQDMLINGIRVVTYAGTTP
ncbi:MAG: hypothetical protein QN178_12135 [Armatimonadota bacterium]|nr:hypothetical protein [Armatimonadota bacterium]